MTTRKKHLTIKDEDAAARAAAPEGHCPRWRFDCGRCKFSWCCDATCACNLYGGRYNDTLAPTPRWRQREVDEARIRGGFGTEFRQQTLDRLKDPD